MPSAIPPGTQPSMSSLAKSEPDSPEVNGRASGGQPRPRTAVPITVNSTVAAVKLSPGVSVTCSDAPTMPWPPRSEHSPVIRSIAVRYPSQSACAIRAAGPAQPVTLPGALGVREGVAVPGQLTASVANNGYTAAPNTWPTGSNPTLLTVANSPAGRTDPRVAPQPANSVITARLCPAVLVGCALRCARRSPAAADASMAIGTTSIRESPQPPEEPGPQDRFRSS